MSDRAKILDLLSFEVGLCYCIFFPKNDLNAHAYF